jgi:A/G-specific adenine glycosylase
VRWYRRHRRDLPWRATRDPYAIWVSEIMLQQTRVATAVPYYVRFLERFPDVRALARASEEAVLSAWSGLGYYRRARALHAAAKTIVERFGGSLPADPASLVSLPGVGRYTAGAIASLAFDLREPVLDGNVRRVLSRLTGARSAPDDDLWALSAALVRHGQPSIVNQAAMELGALVCTPRAPRCERCPITKLCRARAEGRPEIYPCPSPRRKTEDVIVAVGLVRRTRKILIEKPASDSPLRGTWDMPAIEVAPGTSPAGALTDALTRRHGISVAVLSAREWSFTHTIQHRRLRLNVLLCEIKRCGAAKPAGIRWIDPARLDMWAVSGATRKILAGLSERLQNRSHGGTHSFAAESAAPPAMGSGSRGRSKR